MLSFHVANLLIPGDPQKVELVLASGTWTLEQSENFGQLRDFVANGKQCAHTYVLEHPVGPSAGAAAADAVFAEITPILLGASYAMGLSVTILRSTRASEISIMHPSDHWPRDRVMSSPFPIVTTAAEFKELVERFAIAWPTSGQTEKAQLLVNHWIDSLSCWSMEDLYLSATTLLQVIVATEAARQGKRELSFHPGVTAAAQRMGITVLGPGFKDMRNELIHDGHLIGRRFAGPDKTACAAVVANVLNWFDEYVHAALHLGALRMKRFRTTDFAGLNAYSI